MAKKTPQSDETRATDELRAKADAAVAKSNVGDAAAEAVTDYEDRKLREPEGAASGPQDVPGEVIEAALFDNDTARELLHCGCDFRDGVDPLGRFGVVFAMIGAGLIDEGGTTEAGREMLAGWPG